MATKAKKRKVTKQDFTDQFKDEIEDALSDLPRKRKRRRPAPAPAPAPVKAVVKKKQQTAGGFVLGLAVLAILGGAWIYLLNVAPSSNASAQMYSNTTTPYQQYAPLQVDMSQSQQQMTDMQSELDYYRNETSVLQDRVSTMSKKLAVLGALTNENVVVVRDGWPRSHMLTLSKDWSLSRMPQHLKLTEEDQAFLEDWSVRD